MMKIISWMVTPPLQRIPLLRFMFTVPYLSIRSLRYESSLRSYSLFPTLLLYTMLMALFLVVGAEFFHPLNYWENILIAPAIYFLTEAVGALAQLLFSRRELSIYPIHHQPLYSPSLSQFWGRRWNLWVQDWLKDISNALGKHSRLMRIIVTFLVSGIFHEVMVNFPYWLMTGKSYFGTMMAYFLIQAFGLYLDKKFIKHLNPHIRRIYQWLFIILPSPLFINQPLLAFLGISNPF